MNTRRYHVGIYFCIVAFLLSGCAATTPTGFYVLSALDDTLDCPGGRSTSIGIGPVDLPRYLDRPQMMTRRGPNEMTLAEFDLWAEPLKEGIPRILSQNLRAQTCLEVEADAWKKQTRTDYLLTVIVNRFDGILGGEAVLDVKWTLTHVRMNKVIVSRRSTFTGTVGAQDYRALATTYSSLLAAFSREVAETFSTLHSGSDRFPHEEP